MVRQFARLAWPTEDLIEFSAVPLRMRDGRYVVDLSGQLSRLIAQLAGSNRMSTYHLGQRACALHADAGVVTAITGRLMAMFLQIVYRHGGVHVIDGAAQIAVKALG